MSYTSKYTGQEIDNLLDSIHGVNITKTVLWEGDLYTIGERATLSQSLEEFDYLVLSVYHRINASVDSIRVVPDTFINVNEIKSKGYGNNRSLLYQTFIYADVALGTSRQSSYTFPSATEICYNSEVNIGTQSSNTSLHLTKVVGIKLSIPMLGTSSSNPIGSILPVMGTEAPQDYLICDGRELQISEYKELADYFEAQFGSKNHFGGDGVNTFAIPDLRNEFLRGYHGNAEKQLSSEIGIHQDATEHKTLLTNSGKIFTYAKDTSSVSNAAMNMDEIIDEQDGLRAHSLSASTGPAHAWTHYTSRPTNVAVLFCIKYTENGNSNGGSASENYSTEEQRIGTWIDGKPLYRKVYKFDITATPTRQTIIFAKDFGIDKRYTKIDGNVFGEVGDWKGHYKLGLFDWHNDIKQFFMFLPNMENNDLVLATQWSVTQTFTVEAIVEYTKITD